MARARTRRLRAGASDRASPHESSRSIGRQSTGCPTRQGPDLTALPAVALRRMSLWRHARAIALLPGNVTILVPALILLLVGGPSIGWGLDGPGAAVPVLLGAVLIAAGAALWVWTVRLFAQIGQGTL